jgi:RNA polymerase sigma factor (sigma-70 family)
VLAEECVQEAYAKALTTWPDSGIPATPGAWLTTVARRLAIDQLRRRSTQNRVLPKLYVSDTDGEGPELTTEIVDDRLRLIFTCCHPALGPEAQVALTLRLICGLTTSEVARMFLVPEATMAARITRAKKKISAAHVPYRVPAKDDLPERINAVLDVVHLLFTTGHTAPIGNELVRRDLIERSLILARMLRTLLPDEPDVAGLLALILLTDVRSATRITSGGALALLSVQDRSQWDASVIREGIALVRVALERRPPGRFALMAAIAAVHAEAPRWSATDWRELVGLYDILVTIWPSPVVALNRAVAIGFAESAQSGLAALDRLASEPQLASYSYLEAARADFLMRLGRIEEARVAFDAARRLTTNEVELEFLAQRLVQLDSESG